MPWRFIRFSVYCVLHACCIIYCMLHLDYILNTRFVSLHYNRLYCLCVIIYLIKVQYSERSSITAFIAFTYILTVVFLRPVHRYIVPCFPHVCTGFPPSSQKFSLLTNCVCGLNQGTKQPFNLWPVITCASQTLGGFAPQTPRPRTLTVTYMYLSSPLMCWTTPFLKKTLIKLTNCRQV